MWYIYERRKMKYLLIYSALALTQAVTAKHVDTTESQTSRDPIDDNFENNIIDFDEDYSVKYNKKYGTVPWHNSDKFNKDSHRYTIVKDLNNATKVDNKTSVSNITNETEIKTDSKAKQIVEETTAESEYSVIPLELLSTTENILISILESTTEQDLTVIPLSTTKRAVPLLEIKQTVILPSTQSPELNTEYFTTEDVDKATAASENHETTTTARQITDNPVPVTDNVLFITDSTVSVTSTTATVETTTENDVNSNKSTTTLQSVTEEASNVTEPTTVTNSTSNSTTTVKIETIKLKVRNVTDNQNITTVNIETTTETRNKTKLDEVLKTNSSKQIETVHRADFGSSESQEDVPIFTELDTEDLTDVPEDYYDAKDLIPTTAPKTDALSVIFGLAGSVVESVVESVAERVVPKGIFDLFKRMQRQSEALEAERLRSREENGGLGQFTRGILKSISSGLSKPLSQLMAGVRDIGSLDTDRGFVSSVASGVSSVANVANSVADAFKDRVQAIYPGTVWCGDGHASARSSDLGLFFFTDTCCRQHDACKLYIGAGETKYGLTNTGLFTRSHCGCDAKFRECLLKTNSLVSAQIGLTYFNVLGPQCFRKAHPIVKCARRTRITGQKCEEYELDYSKPKMWQWFDNETF